MSEINEFRLLEKNCVPFLKKMSEINEFKFRRYHTFWRYLFGDNIAVGDKLGPFHA